LGDIDSLVLCSSGIFLQHHSAYAFILFPTSVVLSFAEPISQSIKANLYSAISSVWIRGAWWLWLSIMLLVSDVKVMFSAYT